PPRRRGASTPPRCRVTRLRGSPSTGSGGRSGDRGRTGRRPRSPRHVWRGAGALASGGATRRRATPPGSAGRARSPAPILSGHVGRVLGRPASAPRPALPHRARGRSMRQDTLGSMRRRLVLWCLALAIGLVVVRSPTGLVAGNLVILGDPRSDGAETSDLGHRFGTAPCASAEPPRTVRE